MGLTIHYFGILRNPESLSTLVQEVVDIAESLKWDYSLIPEYPDIPVSGVVVSPERCEPLWFTFHKDGFMCNPMMYEYVMKAEGKVIPADTENWLFTKTQYAGVDAHIAIIKFLRYITEKFFKHFELHDESQYWETGDEKLCRDIFRKYDHLMNLVGAALNDLRIDPDASEETVIVSIEKMLKEKFGMKRRKSEK